MIPPCPACGCPAVLTPDTTIRYGRGDLCSTCASKGLAWDPQRERFVAEPYPDALLVVELHPVEAAFRAGRPR